jgi:hypothetical protein
VASASLCRHAADGNTEFLNLFLRRHFLLRHACAPPYYFIGMNTPCFGDPAFIGEPHDTARLQFKDE